MKHRKDAALTSLCADIRPDDGIPPHLIKRQKQKQRQQRQPIDRHALQYAKAAQRCLDGALGSLTGDGSMTELTVVSVEPLPCSSVLLVILSAASLTQDEIAGMESRLRQTSGLLRAAIAGETHRKRVPHLRFRVVPAEG